MHKRSEAIAASSRQIHGGTKAASRAHWKCIIHQALGEHFGVTMNGRFYFGADDLD
jgi:hypothetical protein